MPAIIITILAIFSVLSGIIGYSISEAKPPLIIHEKEKCEIVKNNEPSKELKELSIKMSECDTKLKECWYSYNNDCGTDCVVPECPNFAPERDKYLKEIDSILKSRTECRENESRLADELKECKKLVPFN